MKKTAILYLITLLFIGCASTDSSESKNVSQDEVWQNYWVNYDEAGDLLTAGATFRFGGSTGTTLQLTEPSKLTFEDTELDFTSGVLIKGVLGGTHYGYEAKGAFKNKYTFTYTDNNGKNYVNSIGAKPLEIDEVPEILDAAGSNSILFKSIPDIGTEDLTMTVSKDGGGSVTINQINFARMKADNTGSFYGTPLNELGNGPVTITFTKTKNIDKLQQAGHLGGKISLTYNSKAYKSKIINAKKTVEKPDSSVTTNN